MSDSKHEKIKCMQCHRDVGIHDQVNQIGPALLRIAVLETEVERLEKILFEQKPKIPITFRKGYPGYHVTKGT